MWRAMMPRGIYDFEISGGIINRIRVIGKTITIDFNPLDFLHTRFLGQFEHFKQLMSKYIHQDEILHTIYDFHASDISVDPEGHAHILFEETVTPTLFEKFLEVVGAYQSDTSMRDQAFQHRLEMNEVAKKVIEGLKTNNPLNEAFNAKGGLLGLQLRIAIAGQYDPKVYAPFNSSVPLISQGEFQNLIDKFKFQTVMSENFLQQRNTKIEAKIAEHTCLTTFPGISCNTRRLISDTFSTVANRSVQGLTLGTLKGYTDKKYPGNPIAFISMAVMTGIAHATLTGSPVDALPYLLGALMAVSQMQTVKSVLPLFFLCYYAMETLMTKGDNLPSLEEGVGIVAQLGLSIFTGMLGESIGSALSTPRPGTST
jgi:hypothetical protein